MDRLLLDSHSVYWWQTAPDRMSNEQLRAVRAAAREPGRLLMSVVSLWELAQLSAAGRIRFKGDVEEWLRALEGSDALRLVPLTAQVAVTAARLGPSIPGDPMDRIIVASAYAYGATLVTSDERLRAAGVVPIL